MRKLLAALAIIAVCCPAPADADPGGMVPAPGLCDYPGVGHSTMAGLGPVANIYIYYCDFPTEINGSHWHAELSGEAVQAMLGAGISISFLNVSGSMTGYLGLIDGSTSYRCPDNTLAEMPNPPGAWKNRITPSKCKTIGPNPDIPPPPPEPQPLLLPAPTPGAVPGAVTNPVTSNPDAVGPQRER